VRVAAVLSVVCAAGLVLALSGCGTGGYTDGGSQGNGKQLFTQACGVCHTLADAGTAGTIGPNLDDAFAQARTDGMTSDTFTQVVAAQIKFPIEMTSTGAPGMPAADTTLPSCDDVEEGKFCVADQDQAVKDVAAYVGSVSGTGASGVAGPKPMDGRSIFADSCGSCHTLADAGTAGTIGPNLDAAKPPKALVVDRVTNGKGAMPSFKDSLDAAQIEAVAEYVSSSAGR
jgi:mono/diheme cytochrome c family protein